jgi:hypothetical protein
MLMEHGKQVAQPVRGRQGFQQAGVPRHASSLNAWRYHWGMVPSPNFCAKQANRAMGSSNLLTNQSLHV